MKCYFYSDGNIVEWFICNISNSWVFVIYDTSVKLLYSRIETNPSKMLKDFIDKLKNSITARINSIDIIVASLAKDELRLITAQKELYNINNNKLWNGWQ